MKQSIKLRVASIKTNLLPFKKKKIAKISTDNQGDNNKNNVSSIIIKDQNNDCKLQPNSPNSPITPHNSPSTKNQPATPMFGYNSSVDELSVPSPKHNQFIPKKGTSGFSNISSKFKKSKPKYDVPASIIKLGYQPVKKIANTLQGTIWKAIRIINNDKNKANNDNYSSPGIIVIKVTSKYLHNKSVAVIKGKEISIQENILYEANIMKYLTENNPPLALVKYIDFFEDSTNYFLLQQNGGNDFFHFVSDCHTLILDCKLSIIDWQHYIKILFKQMVELLDFMHTKKSVCHLDISLENMLISNVFASISDEGKLTLNDDLQIKWCDFGLSIKFDHGNFLCDRYVGKNVYKAPKVYGKKEIFDARAADIWSLGIVLFTMTFGSAPYQRPSRRELAFVMIMNGDLGQLIQCWKRTHYLTAEIYDLLIRMLTAEHTRIKMNELKNHSFLK